jgi:hypothetical protein
VARSRRSPRGDHFIAMTAFEIVSELDFKKGDPRTIWASS